MITAITSLLQALTAALRAFPLWLGWRVQGEVEDIKRKILEHESRSTPTDRRLADELRISLAHRSRLHDALLASISAPASGNGGQNP